MTPIIEGQTLQNKSKTKTFSNQNHGHLGSRYTLLPSKVTVKALKINGWKMIHFLLKPICLFSDAFAVSFWEGI